MNRLILTAWLLSLGFTSAAIAADARSMAVLHVLQSGQGQAGGIFANKR